MKMARCLIVCIDGTWNSSAEKPNPFSQPTNVARISELLINDGKRQLVIYRPGVGTSGFVDQFIGGVWGAGSTERICDGYRFLCKNYKPGDRLAFFGFSRGAFAVRSIIGVLTKVGVLRSDQLHLVRKAVSLYREPYWNNHLKLHSFAKRYCHEWNPTIMFVGLWDTVIRYGPVLAPFRGILKFALKRPFGLFDQTIPAKVRHFCHALALDECRSAFWPWRVSNEKLAPEQVLEEMWFAGSHTDVGGGYSDSRSAEFPLRWIAEHAANAGLEFHQRPIVSKDSHLAPLNPSRVSFWRILPSRRRIVQGSDRLHNSVKLRAQTASYRPIARLPKSILCHLTGA